MKRLALALVPSPSHLDPNHPEHPRRLEGLAPMARAIFGESLLIVDPSPAPEEAVLAVHTPDHLDFLRRACAQAPAIIDYAPTFVMPDSLHCAFDAAGATMAVLQAVLDGRAAGGFAAVRPPGHHAPADRAMGFCLLNNVAIAARAAQAAGIERILVFDFDVHHGNGTQAVFDDDPSVLYISTHQAGIYPGTGAVDDVGSGPGSGATVNLPLPAGVGDAGFERIVEEVLGPLTARFAPGLILVSAGFDAHWRDPLAGLQVTTRGYHRLASALVTLARQHGSGRIVFVLEGGYDPAALQEGILASLAAMAAIDAPIDRLGPAPGPEADIRALLERVRPIHRL